MKKYEITGYAIINEGMTLSVKGNGIGKIIWFEYKNGSLIPEHISDKGEIYSRRKVKDTDRDFINEIRKYGTYQRFSHSLLLKSK